MQLQTLIALILTTGSVLSANTKPSRNISKKLPGSPPRIVGGYEVNPEFKYSFIVDISIDDTHWCGGTLYNDDTVITAAHCSDFEAEKYTVQIHRHNLTKSAKEERGRSFKVKKITVHPEYGSGYQNDIAIWKLEKPYPTKKKFIDLDVNNVSNKTGTLLTVVGWGTTEAGGFYSPVLLEVKVPIYNSTKCVKAYQSANEIIYPELQFCAGYSEGGKDACQGDSGGPLFVQVYNKPVLVGIVSWGVGCADPNYPGVYTKVNKYLDWIKENI